MRSYGKINILIFSNPVCLSSCVLCSVIINSVLGTSFPTSLYAYCLEFFLCLLRMASNMIFTKLESDCISPLTDLSVAP